MNKTHTLSLKGTVVEKVKAYAKSQDISLSKLIESYLVTITNTKNNEFNTASLAQSLSGVITLEEDFEVKDANTEYLMEKYE